MNMASKIKNAYEFLFESNYNNMYNSIYDGLIKILYLNIGLILSL